MTTRLDSRPRARTAALTAALSTAALLGGGVAVQAMPWTPTEHDTCSAEFHDSFRVTGRDGELYDGWHPPTAVDPATGQQCGFGHEHGDDPRTSDIIDWTLEKLGGESTGIPFAFAAHKTTEGQEGTVHRHEDHVGHKVFVRNDVAVVREDRAGFVTDAEGAPVVCDHLIYGHQGSHSGDALRNNRHELMYAARCSDGTELAVTVMTGYGAANEYTSSCDGRTVRTEGSNLPDGSAGAREIPTVECVRADAPDFWATYELWKADQTIAGPDGRSVLRIDPWFGVRNPSRVADGSTAVPTVEVFGEQPDGWPWNLIRSGTGKTDPGSPFDGSERDFYVQHTTVDNAGGPTIFHTDAYGGRASDEPFPGSIAQYVSSTSNADQPEPERRAFGFSTDYGADGEVHAPN